MRAVLVLSALAALVTAMGAVKAPTVAAATICPMITATPWVAPYAPHPHGTTYDVKVRGKGWTCQKADAYVRKLVASKVHGNFPSLVNGGPSGWYCTGSRSKSGLAYTGQCSPTEAASLGTTGPGFSWTVG